MVAFSRQRQQRESEGRNVVLALDCAKLVAVRYEFSRFATASSQTGRGDSYASVTLAYEIPPSRAMGSSLPGSMAPVGPKRSLRT